jgi:uncharacterized membrane protein
MARAAFTARWRAAWVTVALGAILVLGAALRVWHLGAKTLWFDETWSVFIARQPLEEIPRLLRLYDHLPPLYYFLLNIWIGLFGTTEAAVRLPSVLAGVGAVGATFLLAARVAGRSVALLAAALLALSPFQIAAAQEARTYSFISLFALGAAYGLWRAVEEGGTRHWLLYAGCVLLALYTHHFSFLLLPAFGIFVLSRPETRPAWRRWVFWSMVAGLLYLPWVPALFAQLGSARSWPEIRPAFDLYFLTDLLGLFGFGGQVLGMGTYFRRGLLPLEYRPAILLPFLLLVIAGVASLRDGRARSFLLTYWAVPVLIAAAISLQWHLFFVRYFSFVLPPFVILMAVGVMALREAARPAVRRTTLVAVLAYLLAFTVPSLAVYYTAAPSTDWRAAGRHLATAAGPHDFVLFMPAFTRVPFEYYFQGPQERMGLNPREVPAGPGRDGRRHVTLVVAANPQQLETVARRHPGLWVVASLGLGTDIRAQLASALAPYFRQSDERTFGQLSLSRWESLLDRPAAP